MSDYVKLVDYAAKDALLSGNPSKIVKGVEIGAEFDAVATAVATKWDATLVNSATSKTTPVDADLIPIVDSAASNILKKLTWANLKATLLTWLQGTVFPAPGAIGATTPSTGAFTTVSATGTVSTSATHVGFEHYIPASTTYQYAYFGNVSGYSVFGVEGTPAALITGATAYDTVVRGKSGIAFSANDGAGMQMRLTSTGVAVTGTLSATSSLSFGGSNLASGSSYWIGNYSTSIVYNVPTGSSHTFAINNGNAAVLSSTGLAVTGKLTATTTILAGKTGSDANNWSFQGYSTAAYTNGLQMTYGGVGSAGLWVDSAGALQIGVDGASGTTSRVVVDASGNAGLGVTPPAWSGWNYATLNFSNAAAISSANQDFYIGSNWYYSTGHKYRTSGNLASMYRQNSGAHYWETAASGTAGNAITFTTAMSLNADGGLANTTVSSAGYAYNGTNSHATTPSGINISFSGGAPNNATQLFFRAADTGAVRAEIRSNGGLANYQTNDANLSDERLKKDFTPAKSYYANWRDIEFVTFLYKDQTDTELNLGVKAQQLESVFPELIDNSGFGEAPEGEAPYKAVYQTDFQYATARALQEAIAEIESLKAYKTQAETVISNMLQRLAALEAK